MLVTGTTVTGQASADSRGTTIAYVDMAQIYWASEAGVELEAQRAKEQAEINQPTGLRAEHAERLAEFHQLVQQIQDESLGADERAKLKTEALALVDRLREIDNEMVDPIPPRGVPRREHVYEAARREIVDQLASQVAKVAEREKIGLVLEIGAQTFQGEKFVDPDRDRDLTFLVIEEMRVTGIAAEIAEQGDAEPDEDELRLVMWTFKIHRRFLELPVELATDYGYMILNVGKEGAPKPHYVLAGRKEGSVQHFDTKKDFVAALEKMEPSGGTMAHYTRCLVPSDYGLEPEEMAHWEVEEICKRLKIEVEERARMRCLCPDVADSKR